MIRLCLMMLFVVVSIPSGSNGIKVFTKNDLLGKFEASGHPDFVRVPDHFASHRSHYLRAEVVEALVQMCEHAARDGIKLQVVSAYRSYFRQKTIWNNKYNRYSGTSEERVTQILRYSSMPGTSRHHWGTDFDLNSVEPSFFEKGNGKAIYEWLSLHASNYGFFQPYQPYNDWRDSGYFEEKWHWSYRPTAENIRRAFQYTINYDDIDGFMGSTLASEFDVIERYVRCIEM